MNKRLRNPMLARSLSDLFERLQKYDAAPDKRGIEVDMTDLPTFSAHEPPHRPGVWSWDRDRWLVGTCVADMEIQPRPDARTRPLPKPRRLSASL